MTSTEVNDVNISVGWRYYSGLILGNKSIRYNKKGQESSVKGHSYDFLLLTFPNVKGFYVSKRALHANTMLNKWLK